MPSEEFCLVSDHRLEPIIEVQVEVSDGVPLELTGGGAPRNPYRWPSGGDEVVIAHRNEEGAGDLAGSPDGSVEGQGEEYACRDRHLPAGGLAQHPGVPRFGVRGGEHGKCAGRADEVDAPRRVASDPSEHIIEVRADQLQPHRRGAGSHGGEDGGWPVGEGVLADDGGDFGVFGGDGQDMPAAEGGAPQADTIGVDGFDRAGKRDRCPVVVALPLDVDEAARLAVASAEVPKCR